MTEKEDRAEPRVDEARGKLKLRHWKKISSRISVGSRSKLEAAFVFWLIGLDDGLLAGGKSSFCFNYLLRLREGEETCCCLMGVEDDDAEYLPNW